MFDTRRKGTPSTTLLRPMKPVPVPRWRVATSPTQHPRKRMDGSSVVALPTRETLCAFVRRLLCDYDRLDPSQTPFFVAPMSRAGRPCGLMFHVEGPRLLKTSALWVADEHRILFYDSQGLRFHEAKLSESPDPRHIVPVYESPNRRVA